MLLILCLPNETKQQQQQQQVDYSSNNEQQTQLPIFHQHNDILHFPVSEDVNVSTIIGNIRASNGDVPNMLVPWEQDKQPLTPDDEINRMFSLNPQTGDISIRQKLDREQREFYYFLGLVMSPFIEVKCTVHVLDINDEAPRFLLTKNESNFIIEMPEGQRGIRRSLPLAVDNDSQQNGIKEFRITSGNTPINMFTLVEHEAPARSALQNSLADEAANAATMIVAGDNPQLIQQFAQQATVLIPSQPIIMQSTPQSSGNQHQQVAPGAGGQYSSAQQAGSVASQLAKASTAAPSTKFHIDLEVSQPLDRENQSSYQLVVEAIDGGPVPLIGRLMVTVIVTDINDNDPVFKPSKSEFYMKEDAAKGTFIHRVQASDADENENGKISYHIKRHTSASQTAFVASNSNIINNNNNSSDINELATGRFSLPSKQQQRPQSMALTSANPKLTQRNSQQQAAPSTVTSNGNNNNNNNEIIEAGESIQVAYKTRQGYGNGNSNSEQLFEIDPVKGEIYLIHNLDYETEQVHELLIEARDHGKPSRSAYTTIKIYVVNVEGDDPPINRPYERPIGSYPNEPSKSESRMSSASLDAHDMMSGVYFQNLNVTTWFAHMNSSLLFITVLVFLFVSAFLVCLVKTKSRQPESDYNDTDGLNPNPQTKPSPNHSTSNEHSNGSNDSSGHHRYHGSRSGRPFAGLNGANGSIGFGSPSNNKYRYPYSDSSNVYHDLRAPHQQSSRHPSSSSHLHHQDGGSGPLGDSPTDHQMANGVSHHLLGGGGVGGGGSAGGTMSTLRNHHRTILASTAPGQHHSFDHNPHHQFLPATHHHQGGHHTSSLTYDHHTSRAALLQHAHHHRSSHHLSAIHQHHESGHHTLATSKGGTMNSMGTHHSALPSTSPLPATPNTMHSSGMPPNLMHHHGDHSAHHLHQHQLPHLHHSHHQTGNGGVGHHSLLPLAPLQGSSPSSGADGGGGGCAGGRRGSGSGPQQQVGGSSNQLPNTPSHAAANIFSNWPQGPGSAIGCYPGTLSQMHNFSPPSECAAGGPNAAPPTSPTHPPSAGASQPIDRWFDLGVSSQLVNAHDLYGSYNWDYLADWLPEHTSIMDLVSEPELTAAPTTAGTASVSVAATVASGH